MASEDGDPGNQKRDSEFSESLFWWEQRESNPRPSACKADALNQLSYAPFLLLLPDCCVGHLSSVGHNRKVASSFVVRPPCTRTKAAAKFPSLLFLFSDKISFCGADGTRTRDPRRDRPVF